MNGSNMFVDRLIALASPAAALRQAIRLIEQERGTEAFPLLTRAAKAGMPEAEYRIARAYIEGAGVPRSQTEGARWLQRAASHGFVEAQTLLAAPCVRGLGPTGGSPGPQYRPGPALNSGAPNPPGLFFPLE